VLTGIESEIGHVAVHADDNGPLVQSIYESWGIVGGIHFFISADRGHGGARSGRWSWGRGCSWAGAGDSGWALRGLVILDVGVQGISGQTALVDDVIIRSLPSATTIATVVAVAPGAVDQLLRIETENGAQLTI